MNRFIYDELYVGQEAQFQRHVSMDMMEKFRLLSGDENPLHTDAIFAKHKGFPDRVVYGMLTASLYSCLVGVYIPGQNCLLQSVHADFLSPVFIGDMLSVSGKIIAKHDSVRQITIKAAIYNQDNKKVSKATIETGVL